MPFRSFTKVVSAHPDSPAIIHHNNRSVSYQKLLLLIEAISCGLVKKGLRIGDRVILHSKNRIELIASYYACLATGATFVPTNPHLPNKDISKIISDSGARFYLGDTTSYTANREAIDEACTLEGRWVIGMKTPTGKAQSWHSLLQAGGSFSPPPLSLDLIASIFYTSGTTGQPKGFAFSRRAISAIIDIVCSTMALSVKATNTAPFYSMVDVISPWSIQTSLASLSLHRPVILTDNHAPHTVLKVLNTYQLSWFTGTPANFHDLTVAAQELDHVPVLSATACVSGGDTCPLEIAQRFHTTFGGHLQNSYGQTEQGCITIHHPDLTKASAPTLGWPLPTTAIKIVTDNGEDGEVGELFVQSPAKTAGRWTDKGIEPVYEDGWIPTGDLVRRHADGCLEALGRQKDLIKIAGYPVYPLEIEEELLRHPDIAKAVVFAIPDVAKGESIIAMIEMHRGKTLSSTAIKNYLADKIAHYKIPENISFVDTIPIVNNKISRRHIAREYLISCDKEVRPLE
ncbi:class I adenylate-forming enzyme family protein [Zymobacter palmae]|uniref:Acyl-CoA synthetases n=1 Tax=Zymobacter palmae TaxID=33074 RepID=A0A348HC07_9GAMM|nr:class I adenylate-forming enzyme family protein [Zymobacter palmae]BBG29159.1 acyl-CoA synthetases [Zymobacter palmae]